MSFLGTNIGVIAPSGIFNPERLHNGMQLLESWGYTVTPSPNLHAKHLCMAGTTEERMADLIWACSNPDINCIWYARGGYGTIQLLSQLEQILNKPILGFSDATALGAHLTNNKSTQFYHAPVVHSLCDLCDEETQGVLKNFLHDGTLPSFSLNPIKNPISGSITAPLVGGNLCMLTTTMGTPFQLDCSNSILMLEDIGEPAYKIHRMFTQLTLSGMLDTVQAIVLGTFTNCTTPKPSQLLLDFILDALQDTPTPIYSGALFGHGAQNHIWNAGRQYTLNEGILYVG